MAFSPLLFLAHNYYVCGDLFESILEIGRDFLWPVGVLVAHSFNASPYQILCTNIAGIGWTIYNCFFCESIHY